MIINKKIGIYITLILSLLIGYYFGENSSGGARIDFGILYPYIEHLRTDLKEGFNIYANNPAILIHSPFLCFYLSAYNPNSVLKIKRIINKILREI